MLHNVEDSCELPLPTNVKASKVLAKCFIKSRIHFEGHGWSTRYLTQFPAREREEKCSRKRDGQQPLFVFHWSKIEHYLEEIIETGRHKYDLLEQRFAISIMVLWSLREFSSTAMSVDNSFWFSRWFKNRSPAPINGVTAARLQWALTHGCRIHLFYLNKILPFNSTKSKFLLWHCYFIGKSNVFFGSAIPFSALFNFCSKFTLRFGISSFD